MLTVGGLFDGIGLLAYGLHQAGLRHAWLCEIDEWRRSMLELRFPGVPIYRDVRDVGAGAARVDVIAGGFPCKGVSSAGRREGFGHPETALWREMARCVRELRPRYVLVENVDDLLGLHDGECFGEVLGELASCGYVCEWDVFPAAALGAPHLRQRVFLTAFADAAAAGRGEAGTVGARGEQPGRDTTGSGSQTAADAERGGWDGREDCPQGSRPGGQTREWHEGAEEPAGSGHVPAWGAYEPAVRRWEAILGRPSPQPLIRRVDDGSARRVERSRLSALGDGVLVQAGWLCGRRILEHEARVRAAA